MSRCWFEPDDQGVLIELALDYSCRVEFTGISAPYEAPTSPEIHIRTDQVDVAQACQIIVDYLEKEELIPKSA